MTNEEGQRLSKMNKIAKLFQLLALYASVSFPPPAHATETGVHPDLTLSAGTEDPHRATMDLSENRIVGGSLVGSAKKYPWFVQGAVSRSSTF